jgi:two-component system, chemotaxis family, CheB/CheR fusion protein
VGIGASAGGLAAFKTFFEHMPPDTGMAFVLVQHLDPQHKSLLVDLLRPRMTMPVVEASDGTVVAENCVYIIPRNATLTINNGVLHVVTPAPERALRRPIDTFFAALAVDQGERAVAIVLSGVGSDGSLGVKSIKEHGGLTLAQAEVEADDEAMRGMPWSAAATGFVDFVLPIEAMPAKLMGYLRHLNVVAERKNGDGVQSDAAEHLSQIIALLRVRTGHDFGGYKSSTLGRRIQRRMQVLQINDIISYLERLRADPNELDLLFGEILVGVTEFFRDPDAFDALAAVMRNVIADKGPDSHVRIWVPGCSTGEEVYSVAIMMREAKDAKTAPKVAIFGTDIDPKAVMSARTGLYRKLPPGLSQARFNRWFSKEGDEYRPTREIRDLCVFSVHNLVKDPPFSKLDLICCRNLLIYFDTGLQHRVAQIFHYALRPGGYLFLGPSESVTRDAKLFAVVDKKHRILQRLDVVASLPLVSAADSSSTANEPIGIRPSISDTAVDKRVRRALEPYSPAYFVIDAGNEIIRFSGAETRHYLEPSSGPSSLNLFALLRTDLRQRVREALQEARAQQSSVARENLIFSIDGQNRLGTLIVEPIGDKREAGPWVIAFRDTGQGSTTASASKPPAGNADVQALEQELRETKARLQSAISDMELHMEEARSATEEYQSVNEELQSANEELETAKEEMQSVNEELQTVNAELQSKNDTLLELNSDLQNLMDSTQIAVVFLDQQLRVKNFTPAIAQIFPLRAADRGRPLIEIVSNLIDVDLSTDLSTVQRTLAMIEREVRIEHAGRRLTLLMRIRPYLTVDNRIDGAVITFVDINKIALAADTEVARYQALSRASEDAIVTMSLEGVISAWSAGAERTFGYTSEEIVGRHISVLAPEGLEHEQQGLLERVRHGEKVTFSDSVHRRKDGSLVHVAVSAAPILSAEKMPIGISKTIRDITEHRNALLISREYAHRTKNLLALVLSTMTLTAQRSMSIEDFTKRFEERLRALSQAHDLLLARDWRGAAVADLVRESLKPFLVDQVGLEMHGPDTSLKADAAQTLSLVLHELATNAAKFGALTKTQGRIAVDWQLDEERVDPRRFRMTWRESGGPTVAAPQKTGFGHELISNLPEHELDAEVTLDYLPGGLLWSIDMPARGAVAQLDESDTWT